MSIDRPMHRWHLGVLSFGALVVSLMAPPVHGDEEGVAAKGADKGQGKGKEAAEPEAEPDGLVKFAQILPLNKKSINVLFPSMEGGVIKSVVAADTMVRKSDEELELGGMDLELFDATGREKEFTIRLKLGEFHIPTRQLSSEQETQIIGRTFTIRGDRSVFDTVTNQGKLEGNIKMVISDLKAFAGKTPEEGEETTPETTGDAPGEPNLEPTAQ